MTYLLRMNFIERGIVLLYRFFFQILLCPIKPGYSHFTSLIPLEMPLNYQQNLSKTTLFTEQCVGLPSDITGLTTTQTFPVLSGTRVTVTCSDTCSESDTCTNTLTLRGDDVITCSDVTEYLYSDRPKCNQLGMLCLYVFCT